MPISSDLMHLSVNLLYIYDLSFNFDEVIL